MSALDKINDMIVRIQSGDEEFVAIFEDGFKKFENDDTYYLLSTDLYEYFDAI